MESTKITLTQEQEELIVKIWNETNPPPSISDLIFKVLNKENADGRSLEGMAIREFLSKRGLRQMAKEKVLKGLPELNSDQKEYIKNNVANQSNLEITRILFNNSKLSPLHSEFKAVQNYIIEINPDKQFKKEKRLEDFKPPRSIEKVITLVNEIIIDAYDPEKYDNNSKRCLEANLTYLSNRRFTSEIAGYSDQIERDMYLSNFIRHTFDKFDLNQADVDTICLFAQEVINHKNLKKRLEKLNQLLEDKIDGEDQKVSMALVENLSQTQKDIDKSALRQSALLSDINEKRSARIKKERESTSSLLNLISAWREEESRNRMIKIAIDKKAILKTTIKELSEMDQFKAMIFGMSDEDFLG